jgi:hypothetical protein
MKLKMIPYNVHGVIIKMKISGEKYFREMEGGCGWSSRNQD